MGLTELIFIIVWLFSLSFGLDTLGFAWVVIYTDIKNRFWLPYDFPPVVNMVVT